MTEKNVTENAADAKSKAPELHELSSEELGAVSGGMTAAQENYRQVQTMKAFSQALKDGAGI